jgi:hypothetical protein
VIRVTCPPTRLGLRRWIVQQVLADWLGQECRVDADQDATAWTLKIPNETGEIQLADSFFGQGESAWLKLLGMPRPNPLSWTLPDELFHAEMPRFVPILYRQGGSNVWLRENPGPQLLVQADLFGSIAWFLGRFEDYTVAADKGRDKHDRLPASASIIGQPELLERPLADEYAELLWKLMLRVWPRLTRPARKYRLRPTHDVDFPLAVYGRGMKRNLRSVGADITLRRDPSLAWQRLCAIPRVGRGDLKADVNNTFGWIMDESERRNLQSTFYFLVDDANYDLGLPFIAELLREMHARGHRIGVHPPLGTYRDGAALRASVERFRTTLREAGLRELADSKLPGRQHFLQLHTPETWRHYAVAGLGSDSTVTFADRAGFAAGTCHSYVPADLAGGELIPLREEPLVAMEASVFSPRYENLGWKEGVAKLHRLGAACKAVAGDFVILWHNSSLITRQERAAYLATLDGCL